MIAHLEHYPTSETIAEAYAFALVRNSISINNMRAPPSSVGRRFKPWREALPQLVKAANVLFSFRASVENWKAQMAKLRDAQSEARKTGLFVSYFLPLLCGLILSPTIRGVLFL